MFTASANAKWTSVERLEATVNSELILYSDLLEFKKLYTLRSQLDPLFSTSKIFKKGKKASQKEVVEFLINEKLITSAFPVASHLVEQEVNTIQANNNISRKNLVSALKAQGFSFEEYFNIIKISIAKRNLIDQEIRVKVHISDDDIKNYYYNQFAKGSSEFLYKLKIITVNPANYRTSKDANDIITRAQKALASGEDFSSVAKRFSDAPSAQEGGDLGTFTLKEMSPLIKKQIKRLKLGEFSSVLGSAQSSFFIIKLDDIQSSQAGRLEKMKTQILTQLTSKEYQHQISLWLERKRANAYIHYSTGYRKN